VLVIVAEYVAARTGGDPEDVFPQTLAFAALGASMAAFGRWVHHGGDLEAHLATAYGALAAGFRG
jgi:hypothetical protein